MAEIYCAKVGPKSKILGHSSIVSTSIVKIYAVSNSRHQGLSNDTPLDNHLEKKILRASRARAYLRARAKFLKKKKMCLGNFIIFPTSHHLSKSVEPILSYTPERTNGRTEGHGDVLAISHPSTNSLRSRSELDPLAPLAHFVSENGCIPPLSLQETS